MNLPGWISRNSRKSGRFPGVGCRHGSGLQECGLLAGTVVVLGGGDGEMAAIGAGVTKLGASATMPGHFGLGWRVFPDAMQDPTADCYLEPCHPPILTPTGTMQAFGASIAWMPGKPLSGGSGSPRKQNPANTIISTPMRPSPVGANGLLFLPYLHGRAFAPLECRG